MKTRGKQPEIRWDSWGLGGEEPGKGSRSLGEKSPGWVGARVTEDVVVVTTKRREEQELQGEETWGYSRELSAVVPCKGVQSAQVT